MNSLVTIPCHGSPRRGRDYLLTYVGLHTREIRDDDQTVGLNLVSMASPVFAVNQIIKRLNQIISENKPYNLRLCTFTLHKFQEKNLNLNRDSNSDLQISNLALYH